MLQYLVREEAYRDLDAATVDHGGGESVANLKKQFESRSIKLYTRVLEYQLRLTRQYSRHRFFRYTRNLASKDGWATMLEEIKKFEVQGSGDVAVIDAMRLKSLALDQKRLFEALFEPLRLIKRKWRP
ncbi:hypothetical protein K432DRAFT_409446 [Lepidopterella palustris CBS 459.81]|uniref:NWD NACHT-NTPase N-terminal domain-containing protein n=1 Tax=Lepidopterella palustris CBS 459.81 TaxID=1314670 RepID=A0A8E2E0J0_9PEZI|nr:hypothetical protein K432DRAFT_409446 [Lepidopterella palustris CBS 459.81]